ncbi:hypothetical protein [Pseudomarimonas salicorniae]|uniref:Uncharacterized protein n=1 Tax=Pseudomarimonas salicorniae TaxID=2933270 RepID=A0ABT0GKG6_9GAMM|nr:hypothetical protein [Lysobacter sp. CAU 1642]MCK7594510.1 hypothetical protein [Lysobacter sp. CAU 1642]
MNWTEQEDRDEAQGWLVERLSALPDADPPAALFGRILATRRRRRWQRRVAASLAVAAGLVVLIGPLYVDLGRPAPESEPIPVSATEEPLPDGPAAAGRDWQLAVLDRRLQAAYDRGADPEHITALWKAREQLVRPQAGRDTDEESDDERILSL